MVKAASYGTQTAMTLNNSILNASTIVLGNDTDFKSELFITDSVLKAPTISNSGRIVVGGNSDLSGVFSGNAVEISDGAVLSSTSGFTQNGDYKLLGGQIAYGSGSFAYTGTLYAGHYSDSAEETSITLQDGAVMTAGQFYVGRKAVMESGSKVISTGTILLRGAGDFQIDGTYTSGIPTEYDVVSSDEGIALNSTSGNLTINNASVQVGYLHPQAGTYNYTVTVNGSYLDFGLNLGDFAEGSSGVWKFENSTLRTNYGSAGIRFNAASSVSLVGSSISTISSFENAGTVTMDANSTVSWTGTWSNTGSITVDMNGVTGGLYKLMDYTGSGSVSSYDNVSLTNAGAFALTVKYNDLFVTNVDMSTVKVNSAWATGYEIGDELESGYYYGFNAFATSEAALKNISSETERIALESNTAENVLTPVVTLTGDLVFGKDASADSARITWNVTGNSPESPDSDGLVYILSNGTRSKLTIEDGVEIVVPKSSAYPAGSAFYIGYSSATAVDIQLDGKLDVYLLYLGSGSTLNVSETGTIKTGTENLIVRSNAVLTVEGNGVYSDTAPQIKTGYTAIQGGTVTLNNTVMNSGSWIQMWNRNAVADTEVNLNLNNSVLIAGAMKATVNGTSTYQISLKGSEIKLTGNFDNIGAISMDADSAIAFGGTWSNTGSITVDMAAATNALYKVIDYTGTGSMSLPDYGSVSLVNPGAYSLLLLENDLYASSGDYATLKANSAWTGKAIGECVADGFYYGINAFDSIDKMYSLLNNGGVSSVVLSGDVSVAELDSQAGEYWFQFKDSAAITAETSGAVITASASGKDLLFTGADQSRGSGNTKSSITIGENVTVNSATNIWFGYYLAGDGTKYPEYLGNYAADITLSGSVVQTAGQSHLFGRGSTMTITETGRFSSAASDLQTRGADLIVNGTGKDMQSAQIQVNHENVEGDAASDIESEHYEAAGASWTLNNTWANVNTTFGINTATSNRASGIDSFVALNASKLSVGTDLTMSDAATLKAENASDILIGGNFNLGNGAEISKGSTISLSGASTMNVSGNMQTQTGTTLKIQDSSLSVTGWLTAAGSVVVTGTSVLDAAISGNGGLYFGTADSAVDATLNMEGLTGGSLDLINGSLLLTGFNESLSTEILVVGGGWTASSNAEGLASGSLTLDEGAHLAFNQIRIGDRNDAGSVQSVTINGNASMRNPEYAADQGGTVYLRYMGELNVGSNGVLKTRGISNGGVVHVNGGTVEVVGNVEAGGKLSAGDRGALIDLNSGAEMTVEQDLNLGFQDDTQRLARMTVDSSTLTVNGILRIGQDNLTDPALIYDGEGHLELRNGSSLTAGEITIAANSSLLLDYSSELSFTSIVLADSSASISVDASGAGSNVYKLMDYTGTESYTEEQYKLLFGENWNENFVVSDSDLYLLNSSRNSMSVNAAWAGSAPLTEVEPGYYYGFNAFSSMNDAMAEVDSSTTEILLSGSSKTENVVATGALSIQGTPAADPTALTSIINGFYNAKGFNTSFDNINLNGWYYAVDNTGSAIVPVTSGDVKTVLNNSNVGGHIAGLQNTFMGDSSLTEAPVQHTGNLTYEITGSSVQQDIRLGINSGIGVLDGDVSLSLVDSFVAGTVNAQVGSRGIVATGGYSSIDGSVNILLNNTLDYQSIIGGASARLAYVGNKSVYDADPEADLGNAVAISVTNGSLVRGNVLGSGGGGVFGDMYIEINASTVEQNVYTGLCLNYVGDNTLASGFSQPAFNAFHGNAEINVLNGAAVGDIFGGADSSDSGEYAVKGNLEGSLAIYVADSDTGSIFAGGSLTVEESSQITSLESTMDSVLVRIDSSITGGVYGTMLLTVDNGLSEENIHVDVLNGVTIDITNSSVAGDVLAKGSRYSMADSSSVSISDSNVYGAVRGFGRDATSYLSLTTSSVAGDVSDFSFVSIKGGSVSLNDVFMTDGMNIYDGAVLTVAGAMDDIGSIFISGSLNVSENQDLTGTDFILNLAGHTGDSYLVEGLSNLSGIDSWSLVLDDTQTGSFKLASDAADFAKTISVSSSSSASAIGELHVGGSFEYNGWKYSLTVTDGDLNLNVDRISDNRPNTNLLSNGVSQILAWDGTAGKVGYTANAGTVGPDWMGVWEFGESSSWEVVGSGHYIGSSVSSDGLLLLNKENNTLAAWTDLGAADNGYTTLGWLDDFKIVAQGDFSGNGYNDIVVAHENGSFGFFANGKAFNSVWNVTEGESSKWKLIGAGEFGAATGSVSDLIVLDVERNVYTLWHDSNPASAAYTWTTRDLGEADSDWSVAGIGDYSGDDIDDLIMLQKSTGFMFAWENGNADTRRWVGKLEDGWEVAATGDYNGDGKDDLLLRELNSGWGGLGYWGAANASNWVDMQTCIESDYESKFSVISIA